MSTLIQAASLVADHVNHLLADPTPDPTTGPVKQFNTDGVFKFMITVAAPILLGILGVAILARARKGEMSATMNSTAVALVGILFLGGAFSLAALGGWITDIIIK